MFVSAHQANSLENPIRSTIDNLDGPDRLQDMSKGCVTWLGRVPAILR
ncbi:MAG: hypothetical protein KKH33_08595 [Alphaproteobacteria bacterium]|nr:hypothetical protein [Alphaproteobacteria bacterium]